MLELCSAKMSYSLLSMTVMFVSTKLCIFPIASSGNSSSSGVSTFKIVDDCESASVARCLKSSLHVVLDLIFESRNCQRKFHCTLVVTTRINNDT